MSVGGLVRAPVPVLMVQWFSNKDDFASRGYPAMSGDRPGCHSWGRTWLLASGGGVQGCRQHLTGHTKCPPRRSQQSTMSTVPRLRNPEAMLGQQGRWSCCRSPRSSLSLPGGAALRPPVKVPTALGEACAPQPTLLSNSREKLIKRFKRLLNYSFRST